MPKTAHPSVISPTLQCWVGRVMSFLVLAFLLFDAIVHILNIPPVVQSSVQLGYPVDSAVIIGIVEFICVIFAIIPQTSVLGTVLLTGYLGGAVASNLRIGNPVFSHTLFPVYTGIVLWGGLFLRDKKIRMLIPIRCKGGE